MIQRRLALSLTVALVLGTLGAGIARAAGPARERDGYTDTFFDDFIFDLCGIETLTTLTERWTFKEFADGSATLHVTRTFVPADVRIPIEKGSGTTFISTDGTRRVVGKPLHLIDQLSGRVTMIDAGWVELDDADSVLDVRGPHPFLTADLVDVYCP